MLVVATPAMASSLRSSEHLFQSYRWKEGRPVFSRAHPFCTAEREALEPTETSPSRPAWRAIIVASVKAGSLLCQTLILGGALDSPNPDKLNSHAAKTYRLRGDSFGYDETVLKNASLST